MHEMSIALNIIDIVSSEARKNNSEKINEVEVEIGQLSGVELESLKFSLDIAKKNTPLANSSTKFLTIDAEAKCRDCNCIFKLNDFIGTCPDCGKFDLEIIKGKELRVKSINIE